MLYKHVLDPVVNHPRWEIKEVSEGEEEAVLQLTLNDGAAARDWVDLPQGSELSCHIIYRAIY